MSENANLKISPETAADEAHSFAEYKSVEAALQPYLTAARSADGKLIRSAFYDHAHIVGSIDGEVYEMPADTFGDVVAGDEPSPDLQAHIAWIDISGPAASARVEIQNWGGHRFTDFFVLYKKDGQWQISSKVYDSHTRN